MPRSALLMVAWLLAVCGPGPTSTSLPSPTTPAGWHTYTDTQFGFSIAYPAGSTVQDEGASPGDVQSYRAFDPKFTDANGYPRGQVELGIYAKDAASLTDWVARHTGPASGATADPITYWTETSKPQSIRATGRDAIYFEWTTASGPTTVHVIAFIWKVSYVFRLEWWAVDSIYLSTMEATGRQMLASFQSSPSSEGVLVPGACTGPPSSSNSTTAKSLGMDRITLTIPAGWSDHTNEVTGVAALVYIQGPTSYGADDTTLMLVSVPFPRQVSSSHGQAVDDAAGRASLGPQGSVSDCTVGGETASFYWYQDSTGNTVYRLLLLHNPTVTYPTLYSVEISSRGAIDDRAITDVRAILGSWAWGIPVYNPNS
jgi:hypothetical protein